MSLSSALGSIFGKNSAFGQLGEAFKKDTMKLATLADNAVKRSHATSAKEIMDQAVQLDILSDDARFMTANNAMYHGGDKAGTRAILDQAREAYEKGRLTQKIKIGDQETELTAQNVFDSIVNASNNNNADVLNSNVDANVRKVFDDAIKVFQEETVDNQGNLISKGVGKKYAEYLNNIKSGKTQEEAAAAFFGRDYNEKGIGFSNIVSGFLNDPEYGASRTKGIIGGYAVGSIGLRYLSGGNINTNANGERDIAGIPFI